MSKHVLISGGSGLIGTALSAALLNRNYKVAILSRRSREKPGVKSFVWDPETNSMDQEAIQWADAIIHLAGAGIGDKRWSKARKKHIIQSRVRGGDLLNKAIKSSGKKPDVFIGASAIGYYGAQTVDKIFNEDDEPANDFQGTTCQRWEASSRQVEALGIRTVLLRIGVTLSPEGGALKRIAQPVKYGMGAPLGNGRQYMPWIHLDDLCGIFVHAIESANMKGSFNAVAGEHVTNRQFTKTLAGVLNRPLLMPAVPGYILKLVLGEMAEIALEGSRVSNTKILSSGYTFKYSQLQQALENLYDK